MRCSVFSSCSGTSPKLGSTALFLRRNKAFAQFNHGSSFDPQISPVTLVFRCFPTNQVKKDKRQECRCGSGFSSISNGVEASDDDFIVVNFYHFVFIEDPEEEVANHLSFLQGLDIHGRVYINEKGINAQNGAIPFTCVDEILTPQELEQKAAEMAYFLCVPREVF